MPTVALTNPDARALAARIKRLEDAMRGQTRSVQLGYSSLDNSALLVIDGDGVDRATLGLLPDGSVGMLTTNGPPPPQPNPPTLHAVVTALAVTWDGTWADPTAATPLDLARVEVHVGPDAAFAPGPATLAGQIERPDGGTVMVPAAAGATTWVKLLPVNTSGVPGPWSDAAQEVAQAGGGTGSTTWYTGLTPTTAREGDTWVDTTNGNRSYYYDGTTWVEITDQRVIDALVAAGTAQATADSKIRTFAQPDPPSGMQPSDDGDVWYETDNGNAQYRWSGTAWLLQEVGTGALATGAVTGPKIAPLAVDAAKLVDAAVTGAKIAGLAVDASKLADGSVSARTVVDGAISTSKIGDGAVVLAKLGAASVDTTKLADGSVAAAKLVDGAVTNAKLGALAVDAAKLADAAVSGAKIAGLAVDVTKLADAAVTGAKLADAAVSGAKIAGLAVDATKLADAAVTGAKIAGLAVDGTKLADAAVTNAKLGPLAVDATKLADSAVSAAKLAVLAPGDNLLPNSSFEADADGDGVPDSWGTYAAGTATTPLRDRVSATTLAGAVKHGTWSAHFRAASLATGTNRVGITLATRVPVTAGRVYTLSADGLASAVAGNQLVVQAQFWTATAAISTPLGTLTWTAGQTGRKSVTVTAPATAVACAVTCWLDTTVAATNPEVWVDAVQLAEGDVPRGYAPRADELLASSVTSTAIAAGAVVAGKIAADAVGATEIVAGAVTAAELAANSVVAGKIAADAVGANEIVAGAVTAAELAAGSVIAGKIAALAVGANELAANSVVAGKIAADAVTAATIAAGSVVAGKVAADAITATEIAAAAIGTTELAANAIVAGSAVIATGAIGTAQIANLAVTDAQVASLAADKITVGTLNARITVSGKFSTSATDTGQRVETGAAGIFGYDATGAQTVSIPVTGSPTFTGTVTGGLVRTAVTGSRIELDSAGGLTALRDDGSYTFKVYVPAVGTPAVQIGADTAFWLTGGTEPALMVKSNASAALALRATSGFTTGAGLDLYESSAPGTDGSGFRYANSARIYSGGQSSLAITDGGDLSVRGGLYVPSMRTALDSVGSSTTRTATTFGVVTGWTILTFTAPPSGIVVIWLSAWLRIDGAATGAPIAVADVEVRTGSVQGAGTVIFTPSANGICANANPLWAVSGAFRRISGLTPGGTYHTRPLFASTVSGQTVYCSTCSVLVMPTV